jgi:YggT family protein
MIFTVLYFLLVIRIILSWFGANPYNEIVNILYRITEPILMPFRRLPLQAGGIDFSPIVAFIVLSFLRTFIVGLLTQMSYRFA